MFPTSTATTKPTRVRSNDGTHIACWASGDGPPLLLVHGATSLHSTWHLLLPHLEPYFQVITIDRRGRGASEDAPAYDISREYEDIAAVVDRFAAVTGSDVNVLGHSYGGECAFGAVSLTSRIGRLALYEGWPVHDPAPVAGPPELHDRLDELLAEGRRDELLEVFFRELVHLTPEEIGELRANPTWPLRIAGAHTVTREIRAVATDVITPARAAAITVPVLLVVGAESLPEVRGDPEAIAPMLADVRVAELPGQQHMAHLFAPDLLAATLHEFLTPRSGT